MENLTLSNVRTFVSDKVEISDEVQVIVGKRKFTAKVSGLSFQNGKAVLQLTADVPPAIPRTRKPEVKAAKK